MNQQCIYESIIPSGRIHQRATTVENKKEE